MKRKILILLCISLICLSYLFLYTQNNNAKALSLIISDIASTNTDKLFSSVLRFHVIANSNNTADQLIKLRIKDIIVSEYSETFAKASNRNECISIIENNADDIRNEINSLLYGNGFPYTCEVSVCNDIFPDKYYGNILFPQGEYTAVKIVLGEGLGRNWWCVLYPPLCFLNTDSDKESLEYAKEHDGKIQIRSRFVRWLKSDD